MAPSLVTKGMDCVAVVRKAVSEINQGNAKDAYVQLQILKTQGTKLAEQAENQAKRLEKVQEYYQTMEEETQRKIGEYGLREQDLRRQRNTSQAYLDSQCSILENKRSDLRRAQNALSIAERKRREKEKEADTTLVGAAVLGGLTGVCTGGVGGLIAGSAIGAVVGQMINENEKRAEREVDRCRSECSSAQSSITPTQQQISSIQSQISSLSSQLTHMKQQ